MTLLIHINKINATIKILLNIITLKNDLTTLIEKILFLKCFKVIKTKSFLKKNTT